MMIRLIRDKVPVGSSLTVILKTGHEFTGTLSEIGEFYITLSGETGEALLTADQIAAWRPTRIDNDQWLPSQTDKSESGEAVHALSQIRLPNDIIGEAAPLARGGGIVDSSVDRLMSIPLPPEAEASIRARVKAIVDEFALLPRVEALEPIEPDFKALQLDPSLLLSRSQRTDINKVWDRLRNRYTYALQIKDFSRLSSMAAECVALFRRHPQAEEVAIHAASIYLKAGQPSEAISLLVPLIEEQPSSRALYTIAAAYQRSNNVASTFRYLQRYFIFVPPTRDRHAWQSLLSLTLTFFETAWTLDTLKRLVRLARHEDITLLLESLVYIFSTTEQNDSAIQVAALLDEARSFSDDHIGILQPLVRHFDKHSTQLISQKKQAELAQVDQEFATRKKLRRQEQEIHQLIDSATSLAGEQLYARALSAIEQILALDPDHLRARELKLFYESLIKHPPLRTPKKEAQVKHPPKGDYYSQANHAHVVERDLDKAERLFRLAIKHNDNRENAIKNLASLLNQQGRTEEAIDLLEGYVEQATDRLKILNMLATFYQHTNAYKDALPVLEQILRMVPHQNRSKVLKQIGYSQIKAELFDVAEATLLEALRLNPQDTLVAKWLDGLRQAQQTGLYDTLDEVVVQQDLAIDFASSLSKFLEFYLERCQYTGVPEARVSSGVFSEEDINKLKGLIEGAGRRRPGIRAQYNLSVAKLHLDLQAEDENRLRLFLRDFAADMGNASVAERKHPDVARSYYVEALTVISGSHVRTIETLIRMIMVHYADREALLDERLPRLEESLRRVFRTNTDDVSVIESLLEVALQNNSLSRHIGETIHSHPDLRARALEMFASILGSQIPVLAPFDTFAEIWTHAAERLRQQNQQILDELVVLQGLALRLDDVPLQIQRVSDLGQKLKRQLDRSRLRAIGEILEKVYDYVQQQAYVERERLATIVQNRVRDLLREIEQGPTKHSLEYFHPYLYEISETVAQNFSQVQETAEPHALECALSIDSYTPNVEGIIECQITISNSAGKSPASALEIQILDSPVNEYLVSQRLIPVTETLSGSESVTRILPIRVTTAATAAQVFTMHFELSFVTRMGHRVQMQNQTLPVRLYSNREFAKIPNPYAEYAQGGPVMDARMFYGRELIIEQLLTALRDSPTNKSLVIYGQKRTGKSSILYHLDRQLSLPLIPIFFSIGDIVDSLSFPTLLYRIIQKIDQAFEELTSEGYPAISFKRPSFEELTANAQLIFHDYMSSFRRAISREEAYRNVRIILLIDEFGYIYNAIMHGSISDSFMKSWKAMLEQGYFGSVVAGPDIMAQFIDHYPNEFQVAQTVRVDYLDVEAAVQLIVDPIRIPESNESRYRGVAVERLIALTAGSPFYIQIICARLVQYMNRKKAPYVTDADIDAVKEELIKSLSLANFDNLVNAGDRQEETGTDQDALTILRTIASQTRIQSHCYRSAITCTTAHPIGEILDDLVRRDVLERQGPDLYRIKVELFKEWLLAH